MELETVIGLEVHVELLTKTKLFCGCENKFGAQPNTLVCPICLGLPGVLPVLNHEAIHKHMQAAEALKCEILPYNKFDRKNYFYPDMPKNFQISQYDLPLALRGCLDIEDERKNRKCIGITRIHLEEDTGKSIHAGETGSIATADYTLLNYNRAGVPLLEIVSEPDMRSPEEAYRYLVNLKKILTWIGISDCKMEEGSLRCDANISLRQKGSEKLGTKTEIKNMNSFRSVRSALEYERKRQQELLEKDKKIIQETRGWEEDRGVTISMRSKEEAHDYRYFPEPDLPPLRIGSQWIQEVAESLPEMPDVMAELYVEQYGISPYDAGVMTASRSMAEFFETAANISGDPKQVANWLMGDVAKYLNARELDIRDTKLTPENLSRMIDLIREEVISGKIGKSLVEELLANGGSPDDIVREKGWKQIISAEELLPLIKEAIEKNPDTLKKFIEGKESLREFFIGQVMKASRGKASPRALGALMDEELGKHKEV